MDYIAIVAVVLIVGVLAYAVYAGYQNTIIKKWNQFNDLYQPNKGWVKENYPTVYDQIENAVSTMNSVVADGKIDWGELYSIATAVYPLVKHYKDILITHGNPAATDTDKTE